MSAPCKGCGKRILWCRTVTGKAIPVDAAPNPKGNLVVIETGNGPQSIVVKSPTEFPDLPRFMPHHATCPAVASFRKPKEKRA